MDPVKTAKDLLTFDESKKGRKVRLVHAQDDFTDLEPGMIGTVDFEDSMGTIHCTWENGSTLGLLPGIDRWEWLDAET